MTISRALLRKHGIKIQEDVDVTHVDFVENDDVIATAHDGQKLEKLAGRYPNATPVARFFDALSSS